MAQLVKNLTAMWETWDRSLGWEDLYRKEQQAAIKITSRGVFLFFFCFALFFVFVFPRGRRMKGLETEESAGVFHSHDEKVQKVRRWNSCQFTTL